MCYLIMSPHLRSQLLFKQRTTILSCTIAFKLLILKGGKWSRISFCFRGGGVTIAVGQRCSGATLWWRGGLRLWPWGLQLCGGGEPPVNATAAPVPHEQSRWLTGLSRQWVGPQLVMKHSFYWGISTIFLFHVCVFADRGIKRERLLLLQYQSSSIPVSLSSTIWSLPQGAQCLSSPCHLTCTHR